jgi:hypothetical protein
LGNFWYYVYIIGANRNNIKRDITKEKQMKTFIITLIVGLIIATNAYAKDEYSYKESTFSQSIRSFVGGHEFALYGPKEKYDYFWYSTSYTFGAEINKYLSYMNTIGIGLIGSREASAPMIEYRILPRLTYKGFYIQAGPGLAHGFNPGDLPHLADSPLYGIISAEVGYEFKRGLSVAYCHEHLSSPFHPDCGLNVGALMLQVKF